MGHLLRGFLVTVGAHLAHKTMPVLDAGLDKALGQFEWYKKKKTKQQPKDTNQSEE